MPRILRAAGRLLRRRLARSGHLSEVQYVAGATDLIDIELRTREYRRHRESGRSRLGGAVRG